MAWSALTFSVILRGITSPIYTPVLTRNLKPIGLGKIALGAILAVILMVAITKVWSYQSRAHNKLVPLSLVLQVLAPESRNIAVDYDYGYGFNPAHQQQLQVVGSEQPQIIRMSISSWKPIAALRVSGDTSAINLLAATLDRAGNGVRISAPEVTPPGTLLVVPHVDNLLSQTGVAGGVQND